MEQYIRELLGDNKVEEVKKAMHTGKPIIVSGVNQSGKTTLARALRANGANAYEDFDVCRIELDQELKSFEPEKLSSILKRG